MRFLKLRYWGPLLCVAAAGLSLRSLAAEHATGGIVGEVTARPAKFRAGVVVRLDKVAGSFKPPVKPVDMNQRKLAFDPRLLVVMRGTTVRFVNDDDVNHNVFTPDGDKYDLGSFPKGDSRTHTFTKTGAFAQLCRIHPEMMAYIVVVDNPYFAVTGDDGRFHIEGVPPGTYTLRAWSERLPEATQQVTVTAGGSAQVAIALKR